MWRTCARRQPGLVCRRRSGHGGFMYEKPGAVRHVELLPSCKGNWSPPSTTRREFRTTRLSTQEFARNRPAQVQVSGGAPRPCERPQRRAASTRHARPPVARLWRDKRPAPTIRRGFDWPPSRSSTGARWCGRGASEPDSHAGKHILIPIYYVQRKPPTLLTSDFIGQAQQHAGRIANPQAFAS